MPAFKLPTLRSLTSIVNGRGQATDFFLRLWNLDLVPRIERAVTDLQTVQEQLDIQQQQLASQLVLINEALDLAGIAVGGTSAASVEDITYTDWTEGPQVDLTGVVAGDLTITGTSLQPISTTRLSAFGEQTGQLRIVEIVGGVDTVVGGPWTFATSRENNPDSIPYISNPGEIPGFVEPRTSTGAVSYRLDARMDGISEMTDVRFYLFVMRST